MQSTKSFATTIQGRNEWLQQRQSLTPEVAAEADLALSKGLLTCVITLIDGSILRQRCDQAYPSDEGDLLLLNGYGILIFSAARNQWVTFNLEQPDNLLCRRAFKYN